MTTKVLKLCFEFGEREFNPQETIQLLKMYGYKFWSWGATQFKNLGDKVLTFNELEQESRKLFVELLIWAIITMVILSVMAITGVYRGIEALL